MKLQEVDRFDIYISPFLFNVVLEDFAFEKRQEKDVKDIQIGMKEIKFSSFIGDIIICMENPKECTKKQLELKS